MSIAATNNRNGSTIRLMAILSLLTVGSLNVSAVDQHNATTIPVSQCPMAASPLVIDGDLDDAAWNTTPVLSPFVTVHGDAYPAAQTEARILHDDAYLFFGVKVFEPSMDKIKTAVTEHDGGVWMDDAIEIFIKPEGASHYFQLIANSAGVREESRQQDKDWGADWKAEAGRFANGWTLEVAIPFEAIGVDPAAGSGFFFNVCRERPHAGELSAWSNPNGSFHNEGAFARAVLVESAPMWWSVRAPGAISGASSYLALDAQGSIGVYKAKVKTYDAGSKKAEQESEIELVAGDLHSFDIPFTVPGMDRPGVRLGVYASAGDLVFETGILPLMVTDRTAYELTRAAELITAVTAPGAPAVDPRRLDRWRARLDTLEKEPDEGLLKALSQELEIAVLMAKLPEKKADTVALPFTVPPFEMTSYDLIPDLTALHGAPHLAACKGEYEPASVNLLALEDLKGVTLNLGDLRSEDGALFSPTNIDLRIVKNWYQAGRKNQRSSQAVFVPELLLKDDGIITPDHKTRRNRFAFDENVGPVEPEGLQPVDIPAFHNRQFWLLAHVPEDQLAGDYAGDLEFVAEGKTIASVPLRVRVLPLRLEDTDATFSMYCHERYSMGKNPDRDIFYENMLAMCKAYGMTSLMVQEGLRTDSHAGDYSKYEFDVDTVRKGFELRMKYGLDGLTVYNGTHWMDTWLGRIWKMKSADLEKREDPVIDTYIEVCRKAKAAAVDAGFPGDRIYVGTHDEPGYDPTGEKLKQTRFINAYTHEAGVKVSQAITAAGAKELGTENLDLPIFSGEGLSIGPRKQWVDVPLALHYYHPLEDPRHDRMLTGVVVWYNMLDGAIPYAIAALGGWDDWKGIFGYRPERYLYDGKHAPVPTIQFEAFREGVDDYKYLEMIERRCAALKGKALTPEQREVLAEAQALIEQPPKAFQGSCRTVEASVTAADFAALRQAMQDVLVRLDAMLLSYE